MADLYQVLNKQVPVPVPVVQVPVQVQLVPIPNLQVQVQVAYQYVPVHGHKLSHRHSSVTLHKVKVAVSFVLKMNCLNINEFQIQRVVKHHQSDLLVSIRQKRFVAFQIYKV